MRESKIDRLILDKGWKGLLTRVIGITLVYFGMKFHPDAMEWLSVHANIGSIPATQTERQEIIFSIFKLGFGFALAIDIVGFLHVLWFNRVSAMRKQE
jgi:hypothetical protein